MSVSGKGPKLKSAWSMRRVGRGLLPLRKKIQWGDKDIADAVIWGDWVFEPSGSSPIAYGLTGTSGSYAITGVAATLLYTSGNIQYALSGNAGSYVISGNALALTSGKKLTCASGSYTLTGIAASLTHFGGVAYTLSANTGSYAISGNALTLKADKNLTCASCSYTLTGSAANLQRSSIFALSGKGPKIKSAWLMRSGGGFSPVRKKIQWGDIDATDAIIWNDWAFEPSVSPTVPYGLTSTPGAYAISGVAATLSYAPGNTNYTLTCNAGSYAISGNTLTLRSDKKLTCAVGSYATSGNTLTFKANKNLNLASGSISVTGNTATFRKASFLSASPGNIAYTGLPATFSHVSSSPTAYGLSGLDGLYFYIGNTATFTHSSASLTGVSLASAYVSAAPTKKSSRKSEEFAMAFLL